MSMSVKWNYTTWLDFAAVVLGAWLLYLHLRQGTTKQGAASNGHAH